MRYDFTQIEKHWQTHWENEKTFRAPNPGDGDFDPEKPKYYVLDMFPYPSGVGLHVGHPLGYIATDIVARYKRMCGFNVLHPMGFDAFGLPAEQFAVEQNVHPRVTTEQNIANMVRQLKRLGLSYDWDRSIATTDVDYYKWTQWIFLQLFDSWFDSVGGRARPINELVSELESERYFVLPNGDIQLNDAEGLDAIGGSPIGMSKWHELDGDQQRAVIDNQRLAYLDEVPVNWCPALGTVLANEEVTADGKSERGNHPVFKRPLKQWMLRITAYADRLADDLEKVDWPDAIKQMQRNWIGRSEGAMVDFAVADNEEDLVRVFTTRPDTLFGATYMVLAPEHVLVDTVTTAEQRDAVKEYQQKAAARSDVDRMAEAKDKTGVFTGAYAINPVNNERIPIWIADYVLMGYGTGAIMAVPAHDDRDFAFAQQFGLPIKPVVLPHIDWLNEQRQSENKPIARSAGECEALLEHYVNHPEDFPECFSGEGTNVNSANDDLSLDELPTADAKERITEWLLEQQLGSAKVQYKLRDWLFSRQRYWGEPFPVLHDEDGNVRGVDVADLPVEHPHMDDFKPVASDDPEAPPQPPLGRAGDSWKKVQIDGKTYTREVNTMPQWAGSCWYYLRFIDPKNSERFVGKEAEKYWMVSEKESGGIHTGGVDLYVGGVEHAVLHLLYARFWHKVLFDLGHVSTPEPFGRLFNQGYIQAYAYTDERGVYVPAEEVQEKDGNFLYDGNNVKREFGKMGKSLKNAITPDEICEDYGCDTMRLYEMYMGPLDQSKVWNTRDITGVHRFLQRFWRNMVDEDSGELKVVDHEPTKEHCTLLHKTIQRVTNDMDRMSFNTAIAALIELNNEMVSLERVPREIAEKMVLLLSPIAPHVSEQLWSMLGNDKSLAHEPWPEFDEAMLLQDEVELPVQINGKVRGHVKVSTDADKETVETLALTDAKVKSAIGDMSVKKVIVVPGRMVNIVVK